MSVAAVMLVKDEADIIGPVLHHLKAEGIDQILLADNMSEDNTAAIAELYGCEIVVDDDPGYRQDSKTTTLAHAAYDSFGADWILPVDADEVFYWQHGTLAEFFDQVEADIVVASGWDHLATDDDDPTEPNPLKRITRRRQQQQTWGKVAFRYRPDVQVHMGNHDVTHPGHKIRGLNYRHFQYRSFEQMVRKVRNGKAAYEAAPEIHEMHGTHWREAGALSDADLFRKWRRLCEEPGLIEDPCPFR